MRWSTGSSASMTATAALLAAAEAKEERGHGRVADLIFERSLFECAGVGLSADETYKVYASLVAPKVQGPASVRFTAGSRRA